MEKLIGNAIVGQSGGPTATINATLSGVIKTSFKFNNIIKLYGMRNGIEGFLEERFVDLYEEFTVNGDLNKEKLNLLEKTPASALGSCRKKLPEYFENESYYDSILEIFKKYNIRYFFLIGGNDSMDTIAKISNYMCAQDFEVRFIGLPKTIDNDLVETDHTPGFASAAKYIASTMQNIILDCSIYDIPAVTIVEIMGRNTGWLTSAAALSDPAPDLIYLPERAFSIENFISDIEKSLNEHPNVVVAVSEGLLFNDGTPVSKYSHRKLFDEFGHEYFAGVAATLEEIVKEKFGCKTRSIELNICQRTCSNLLSAVDLAESINVGVAGVEAAMYGASGCMVSIIRSNKAKDYGVTYETVELSKIANKIKILPDNFINQQGNGVTEEGIKYLLPLIDGDVFIEHKNGITKYCKI